MHFFLPDRRVASRPVRYVLLLGIVFFALISGIIPAFQILHAKELQSEKSLRPVRKAHTYHPDVLSQAAITRKITATQLAALKREKRRVPTTPTPTPIRKESTDAVVNAIEESKKDDSGQEVSQSGSQQSLLQALNNYRQKKGKSPLTPDSKLATFAQTRAEQFLKDGKMDGHEGFRAMFGNNGYQQMGFLKMGENSSMSDNTDYVYIVESLYAGSAGHEENQLNTEYTHVGIGVSGRFTNIVFGGKKI